MPTNTSNVLSPPSPTMTDDGNNNNNNNNNNSSNRNANNAKKKRTRSKKKKKNKNNNNNNNNDGKNEVNMEGMQLKESSPISPPSTLSAPLLPATIITRQLPDNTSITLIISTCVESFVAALVSICTFLGSILWLFLYVLKTCFVTIFFFFFTKKNEKIYAQSILITGASAGIGKGLALAYAKRGARLVLIARRKWELERVKKECIAAGSRSVTVLSLDVRDKVKMDMMLKKVDDEEPLDLIIANAGVLSNTDGINGSERVLDINVRGSLNTVYPLLERFSKRKYGQILFMSSLGAFAPVNNAFMMPYLASKASINQFAMGLRTVMKPYNVGVSVACLGMIESDLTVKELQGQYEAQLLGFQKNGPSCERVISAVEENTALITFPLWLYILTRCIGTLPYSIINIIGEDMNRGDPFSKIDHIHPIFSKRK